MLPEPSVVVRDIFRTSCGEKGIGFSIGRVWENDIVVPSASRLARVAFPSVNVHC